MRHRPLQARGVAPYFAPDRTFGIVAVEGLRRMMDGGVELATDLHRFSVHDYHRIAEIGMFDDVRVELIRGAIVDMAPIGTSHVLTVMQLIEAVASLAVTRRARISVQSSVRLDHSSEPEPDLVLLSRDSDRTVHPRAPDVLLVVEVADSTLTSDRTIKGPLYAQAGIIEYWIVNLVDRLVEVYRDPGPDGYRSASRVMNGSLAPLALPEFEVAVADILPPIA